VDQQDNSAASPILWHPAFVEALRLELEQYGDALEFYPEYQLTTGPRKSIFIVFPSLALKLVQNLQYVDKLR
jgi:hypothetical protein